MFTLQKYTTHSPESLAVIYQSTRHDIPENCYIVTDHISLGLGTDLTATSR